MAKDPHHSYGASVHGPAKGFVHKPACAFTADSPTRTGTAHTENGDVEEQAYRAAQRQKKRDLRDRMMAVLVRNAEDDSIPALAQITAADKVLDRIDGKPIASVNMQATVKRSVQDFSDEELIALAGTDDDPADDAEGHPETSPDSGEG
jgi:hypothetical protein